MRDVVQAFVNTFFDNRKYNAKISFARFVSFWVVFSLILVVILRPVLLSNWGYQAFNGIDNRFDAFQIVKAVRSFNDIFKSDDNSANSNSQTYTEEQAKQHKIYEAYLVQNSKKAIKRVEKPAVRMEILTQTVTESQVSDDFQVEFQKHGIMNPSDDQIAKYILRYGLKPMPTFEKSVFIKNYRSNVEQYLNSIHEANFNVSQLDMEYVLRHVNVSFPDKNYHDTSFLQPAKVDDTSNYNSDDFNEKVEIVPKSKIANYEAINKALHDTVSKEDLYSLAPLSLYEVLVDKLGSKYSNEEMEQTILAQNIDFNHSALVTAQSKTIQTKAIESVADSNPWVSYYNPVLVKAGILKQNQGAYSSSVYSDYIWKHGLNGLSNEQKQQFKEQYFLALQQVLVQDQNFTMSQAVYASHHVSFPLAT